LSPRLQNVVNSRLTAAGAPLPYGRNPIGHGMCAPTIVTHGSDDQKRRYLRPLFTGEEIWCQMFSEPGAGSDVASLSTRAVRDGEEWVLNGQKVWTTLAHIARFGMLIARTDPEAPKHKGLTYFLLDMEQEEVQVRPLRQITGVAEFNELFIDGARIPDENVLGGVGNGWKVALTTLMNERAGLGFFLQVRLRQLLDRLIAEAAAEGRLEDPVIADKLGELHLRAEILRLTAYRGLTAIQKYGQPGPEGSLTKWIWSDTNQQLTQFAAQLLGPRALRAGEPWAYELMRARGNSIEGGTTEVLKNIVAERVLGLPKAR
jgi:alkylation response protein AidB-like acyl-CoA dehydrogenase